MPRVAIECTFIGLTWPRRRLGSMDLSTSSSPTRRTFPSTSVTWSIPRSATTTQPRRLWAGQDGLEVIRRVVNRALVLLRPGGSLVVEHSERHERLAPEVLTAAGFIDVSDHPDLTSRPRFSVGSLPC